MGETQRIVDEKKWDALVLICAELSAALNGYSKLEVRGALYRPPLVNGTAFTDISVACNKKAFLKRYSLN